MERIDRNELEKHKIYYFVQKVDKEGLGADYYTENPFDSDEFIESNLDKVVQGGHIMRVGDNEFNIWNTGNSFLMVDWQHIQHYAKSEKIKVNYK
jgi:hypothetical protein